MARRRDPRLTLEQWRALSRVRSLGKATALPIHLEDAELARLAVVILRDVGQEARDIGIDLPPAAAAGYYDCSLDWFMAPADVDFVPTYLRCLATVPDFDTYFKALAELHKRRRKYALILSRQPLPKMIQVAPRALLEFGIVDSRVLASWMTWRKWFYDIDNRAAQETGYLFEPILASALGGISYSARTSPIRRRNDSSKRRQVDCIVGRTAYEFKLRVTIAASGQGRFAEELDFAADCRKSRYRPVLLVLDPTSSSRLDDLRSAFARAGGEAFVGDAAWRHLETLAGPTMATFIEKYVRRPIAEVDRMAGELLDLSIAGDRGGGSFALSLHDRASQHAIRIPRHEDQALASDDEDDG